MPVSRMSMRMKKALGLPGSGMWSHEYTTHSGITTSVRAISGREIPSRPRM